MLLIIFLGIMTTLAIGQGMLVLFLIRSRGHMLALASEVLKLQQRINYLELETMKHKAETSGSNPGKDNEKIYCGKEDYTDPRFIRLAPTGS